MKEGQLCRLDPNRPWSLMVQKHGWLWVYSSRPGGRGAYCYFTSIVTGETYGFPDYVMIPADKA